jgi:hypothetical protein
MHLFQMPPLGEYPLLKPAGQQLSRVELHRLQQERDLLLGGRALGGIAESGVELDDIGGEGGGVEANSGAAGDNKIRAAGIEPREISPDGVEGDTKIIAAESGSRSGQMMSRRASRR